MTDELSELTARAAEGDRAALDELLERYLPEVRAFVRLRAGAELRAQESCSDMVQSVCREVLEHGGRFRHPDSMAFKRWLFTTALRKIQNRRRYWTAERRDARRAERIDASAGMDERRLFECYESMATPSQVAMVREEVERFEAAFEELPDEYREVISLAHIVGMSRKEIAEEMGRTEEAVRSLLHRALARLATLSS